MSKAKPIRENVKDLSELSASLMDVYSEVRNGAMELKEADALANLAGKITKIAITQIEAYKIAGKKPDTKFLLGK